MTRPDKFLLHVGLNKTGTSSIQKMLGTNAPALARAGWVYPDSDSRTFAHHDLARAMNAEAAGRGDPGAIARFRAATADPDLRYILSSELFFRTVRPEIVARHLPPAETRIVVYLRDHLAYMMSWYAQAVQGRNVICNFQDYVRLFAQPLSGYLDAWEGVYGRDRVTVRIFDRARLTGGDARRDLLSLLEGVDPANFHISAEESNLSISGNLLFFKRLLNNYMTAEEAATPPIADEIGALAVRRDSFRGRFRASHQDVQVVRVTFRDDRQRLRQRGIDFGPPPDSVEGHPIPNFDTLDEDLGFIKKLAVRRNMHFLAFAERWQDWRRIRPLTDS